MINLKRSKVYEGSIEPDDEGGFRVRFETDTHSGTMHVCTDGLGSTCDVCGMETAKALGFSNARCERFAWVCPHCVATGLDILNGAR